MKKLFWLGLFLASNLMCEESYTLLDCERMTLQRSRRLSIAEINILIAKEKINEILAYDTPTITADAVYGLRNKHPGVVRKVSPMPAGPPPPPGTSPPQGPQHRDGSPTRIKTITGNKKTTNTKIALNIPIYDFGYTDNLVEAQNSTVEETVCTRDRVEQDLLLAVVVSYYRALENAKIESVVSQSIKLLTQQLATAQDLYSVGSVTKNDVLGVEVQLAERKQELIQVQHNIESALASLYRLTEVKITKAESLQDISHEYTFEQHLESCLAHVKEQHPDLKKIQATIKATEAEYRAIRCENYPDITGFVNFQSSSDSYLMHKNWIHTGIGIQIPIFDGGVVQSKLIQKTDRLKTLELSYESTYKEVCLQVTKAFLKADAAYNKVPVAHSSISYAEENMRIDKDLYEEGLLASDDLLNDETRLAQARSNYYQALYTYQIAKFELEYAMGTINPQGESGT